MTSAIIVGTPRKAAAPLGTAIGARLIDRHITANFYPTPPEATRALLSVESFEGSVWEPACGKGHIAEVLKAAGCAVIATDLNDWGYGVPGKDFLKEHQPRARHIVTNPPYGRGLADAFVTKALALAAQSHGKVAMLLNLASLAHPARTGFWRSTPPARVWAIDSVVCWPDAEREPPKHFREHRYCWAVWEPQHRGATTLGWLSAADFRAPHTSFSNNERPHS